MCRILSKIYVNTIFDPWYVGDCVSSRVLWMVSSLSRHDSIPTRHTMNQMATSHIALYSLGVHTLFDTQLTSRWLCVSVCWHKNVWSLKQSPTFSDYTCIVLFVASPSRVAFLQRECASAETSRGSFRIRGYICKEPNFIANAINLQFC